MDNIFFDIKKLKYLGENCIIGKTVRIRQPEKVIIGDNTIIDDFAYISTEMEIGDYCHIASHVNISGSKAKFKMGDYSTLASHVSIHCASSDYNDVSLELPSIPEDIQFGGTYGDVIVDDYVTIGSHSVILPKVHIPNGVSFGAFSLITEQDYRKWSLYTGIPTKYLKDRNNDKLIELRNKGLIK